MKAREGGGGGGKRGPKQGRKEGTVFLLADICSVCSVCVCVILYIVGLNPIWLILYTQITQHEMLTLTATTNYSVNSTLE